MTYGDPTTRTEKPCSSCKKVKPLTQFHRNKARRDGYQNSCSDCGVRQRRPYQRASDLKRSYNLTLAEYEALFEAQGGRCAVCRCGPEGQWQWARLCVDHDHSTGQVRGLLCDRCNTGIGLLRDDPEHLEAAAAYLRNARSAQ